MSRELTYEVSQKRLARLCRSAGRKVYGSLWLARWILIAGYAVVLVGLLVFDDILQGWLERNGVPIGVGLLFWIAIFVFVGSFIFLRRLQARQIKARAEFDGNVRLKQDENGLNFISEAIDYYLKWNGVTQMFLEPDGVVVSHSNLFFFIPNTAFADASDRLAFIRDVYGHMSEKARSMSNDHIREALQNGV